MRIMCQNLGRSGTDCLAADRMTQRLNRDGDALLHRLAQDGRLVLLVDALDEISRGDGHDTPLQIGALQDF